MRIWLAESSSSSRSPSARSPSGPGFRAFMNMEVTWAGPDISMPGFHSSSGTCGTCHVFFVALFGGMWAGCLPFLSAEFSLSKRASRAPLIRS